MTKEQILREAKALQEEIKSHRLWLHTHAETGFDLTETKPYVKSALTEMGYAVHECGKAGLVTTVGKPGGKVLLLRADMDALPIAEEADVDFACKNGRMHACGHDMHTAIAAGIACELNRVKDRLNCNILVLFQPAEEANPVGGARPVTEAGFLTDEHIDEMYGLHMWPSLPVGDIELRPGPIMAASDRFRIEVLGTAAHAAEPHLGVDAIVIGSEIDCALVQKLRREVNPFEPVSVSIGSFQTFGRYNVVCDRAVLDGTVRTTSEESRNYLHRRIREIPQQIASLYGGQAKVDIQAGYGVLRNSPELFQRFSTHAARLLGQEHVHTDIHPSLIGEDFYYFSHQVPSLYFHIGCQAEHPLHNDAFLPREEVLGVAIDLMTDYFLAQA